MNIYNYHTVTSGADPGFVGPEAFKILGAIFKKKDSKLRIQNQVRKWVL